MNTASAAISGARTRILRGLAIALLVALAQLTTAQAGPAKAITFTIPGGAIEPAGPVPFDQWISATSKTTIPLADGQELEKFAILDFCGGSQKGCPPTRDSSAFDASKVVPALPECSSTEVRLPIHESCTVPVAITPTADSKGVTVQLSIPPLQYNSAYQLRLSLIGKKTHPVTADALGRIDARVENAIQALTASPAANPTATDICLSLVQAIKSEFQDAVIDEPLNSCQMGTASTDQMAAMEGRIELALNSRYTVLEALRRSDPTIDVARSEERNALQALRGSIKEVVRSNIWIPLPLFTAADAVTTRANHISADAGLVYDWDMNETTTYLGTNIYLRPVNRDVSLASLKAEGLLRWQHRLSFTLGVTLESIEKAGERKGIIGSSALVVGAGWRLTDVIRLTAGVLVFKEENPNPLVTNDASLTVSPYAGVSFDLDVAKAFGKVFNGLP